MEEQRLFYPLDLEITDELEFKLIKIGVIQSGKINQKLMNQLLLLGLKKYDEKESEVGKS
ncbi:MAG: hypothetical protein KDK36_03075 [Leptospiraceae bacterium]|nr:hypothetical protein [Leptospiraceae bacterium]